jgi:flagellar protein FlgJ
VKLREAAQNFESVFLHQLVKMMRATVEKSGLISGGRAEEIFQDMLDEQYAGALGKNSNLGLADMIYKELKGKKP